MSAILRRSPSFTLRRTKKWEKEHVHMWGDGKQNRAPDVPAETFVDVWPGRSEADQPGGSLLMERLWDQKVDFNNLFLLLLELLLLFL